jgi:hypothetical protein
MSAVDMFYECGQRLYLVPMKYRTQEVCELALKDDPMAIKHVPGDALTENMIVSATVRDYDVITYIPVDRITLRVAFAALAAGGGSAHRLLCIIDSGIIDRLLKG